MMKMNIFKQEHPLLAWLKTLNIYPHPFDQHGFTPKYLLSSNGKTRVNWSHLKSMMFHLVVADDGRLGVFFCLNHCDQMLDPTFTIHSAGINDLLRFMETKLGIELSQVRQIVTERKEGFYLLWENVAAPDSPLLQPVTPQLFHPEQGFWLSRRQTMLPWESYQQLLVFPDTIAAKEELYNGFDVMVFEIRRESLLGIELGKIVCRSEASRTNDYRLELPVISYVAEISLGAQAEQQFFTYVDHISQILGQPDAAADFYYQSLCRKWSRPPFEISLHSPYHTGTQIPQSTMYLSLSKAILITDVLKAAPWTFSGAESVFAMGPAQLPVNYRLKDTYQCSEALQRICQPYPEMAVLVMLPAKQLLLIADGIYCRAFSLANLDKVCLNTHYFRDSWAGTALQLVMNHEPLEVVSFEQDFPVKTYLEKLAAFLQLPVESTSSHEYY